MPLDVRLFLLLGKYLFSIPAIGLLLVLPGNALASGATWTQQTPSVAGITAMLGGGDQLARQEALSHIHQLGLTAFPALIEMGKTGSIEQKNGAVIGLALMPIPELAIDPLVDMLSDPNTIVRSLAAHALAKIGSPAAFKVAKLLGSTDNNISTGAALALTRMQDAAVPALSHTLGSDNDFVKAKAAWLLGRLGPTARQAVPALVRALDTKDQRVMHVVAEAIDLIGADPAVVYHEMLLIGITSKFSPLKKLGGKAAPTLATLLTRPGTPTGHAAMFTLAKIGKEAEPALLDALKTGNGSQRTAAALLLSDIDPDIVHTLPDDLRESLAGARRTQ